MKTNFRIFVIFIFTFSVFSSNVSYAQSTKTVTVKAYLEPFFVYSHGNEYLAEHEMITYDNQVYIPLIDIVNLTGGKVQVTNNKIHIDIGNTIHLSIPLAIKVLPKKTVNPLNDILNFTETIHSYSAVLIENNPNQIMYSKNGIKRLYPASTTKIMTALLALEHGNLQDKVTVSSEITNIPFDSSRANIQPGDQLTLEQLLYAMMVPSGNDAAVAIAVHIAGSEKQFVKMMNEKAKRIGALNTNFMNPHGYHHQNQYTTGIDLAKIAYTASKNRNFHKLAHPSLLLLLREKITNTSREHGRLLISK